MTKPARSLKARRTNVSAPPVSGIAAVPSAYESETSRKTAPDSRSTSGVSPSATEATMPEREVDRGADLAVRDGEERGRVEDALEAAYLPGH